MPSSDLFDVDIPEEAVEWLSNVRLIGINRAIAAVYRGFISDRANYPLRYTNIFDIAPSHRANLLTTLDSPSLPV